MFVSRKQLKRLIGESLKVRQQSSAVTMTPSRLEKIISEEVVRLFEQASSGADPDGIYRDPSDPNYEYRVQAGEWEGRNRGGTSWVKMAGFGDAVAVLTARWPDAIAAVAEPAIEPAAEPAIEPAVDDADGRRIQLDPMFIPPEEWSSQDGRIALTRHVLRGPGSVKPGAFMDTDEGIQKRDIGSSGPAVIYVQHILGIPTSGFFGHGTYKAVQEFQRDHDLTHNGAVDKWTAQELLTLSTPLDYSRVWEEAGGDPDLSQTFRVPVPGEGSIDDQGVEQWLTTYWEPRQTGSHAIGRAVDLTPRQSKGTTWASLLEIIKETLGLGSIKALDETYVDPAPRITPDYSAEPGDSPMSHYHIEIKSINDAGHALIEEQLGESGETWRDYLRPAGGANVDGLESLGVDYLNLLAAIAKRDGAEGVVINVTSGLRGPARQARAMVGNGNKLISKGEDVVGYFVNLYGRWPNGRQMGKAIGHALLGRNVRTTTPGSADSFALADIEGRDPALFDPAEVV